jgi:hypothetical protein
MKKKILSILAIAVFVLQAFAQTGTISNISVQQRTDGSGMVDVYFTLNGSATSYNVLIEASFDGGNTYTPVPAAHLSGDVSGISPGTKHIVWDGLGSFPNTYSTQSKLKLIATVILPGNMCNCQEASFCDLFLGPDINPNWSPISGTWNIHSEGLNGYWSWNSAQSDQGIVLINQNQYDPNSFIATVKVKVRTGFQIGGERFVLRHSSGNQIMISFDWSVQGVFPHVRINSSYYSSFNTVENFPYFNNNLGDENEYTIKKINNNLSIYVNGYLATEFIDTWFNGNTVFGLATYGTSYYREFRICSANF